MHLSIVLPTYNRLDQLQRVIAGLEQQTYPCQHFEVVIVSDGSSDGTNEYIRTIDSNLCVIPVIQDNQGVAVARNTGIAHTTGDIILFIDDDVVPTPQLITEHLKLHNDNNAVVMGPMLAPPDFELTPWVAWEQAMLMKQYQCMVDGVWEPSARQFYTGNTSLGKHHLLEAGGFDPTFRRAEDVELAYRLADKGVKFLFNPDAIGYHYAIRSFNSWMAIPYAYGRNDVIFTQKRGQSWLLPAIWYEFHGRHPLIRTLAKVCLDRPLLTKLATNSLRLSAALGSKLHINTLPRMAYSGLFNLRHYQGVADQLGGRDQFFAGVADVWRRTDIITAPT